jgi:hypothetical protein
MVIDIDLVCVVDMGKEDKSLGGACFDVGE